MYGLNRARRTQEGHPRLFKEVFRFHTPSLASHTEASGSKDRSSRFIEKFLSSEDLRLRLFDRLIHGRSIPIRCATHSNPCFTYPDTCRMYLDR